MLSKEYLYINQRRHQVSIETEIIDRIKTIGYSLDSFLQDDLDQLEIADFSSKKIKEIALHRLALREQEAQEKMLPNDFTFVDLFAGIGGFRLALEKQRGKCLAYSEIQWDSLRVYAHNFVMNELFLGDIKEVTQMNVTQAIDLIVGGVPCQSWSSAGKNRGFDDDRGRLWLETIRIVKENQPKSFLFENVKGLTDPRHSKALKFILKSFEDIGYFVKYKVLSSKDFGLVQDRERIFLVGFKERQLLDQFIWPNPMNQDVSLGEVIKLDQYQKYGKQDNHQLSFFDQIDQVNTIKKQNELNDYFIFSDVRTGETTIHSWDFMELTAFEKKICLKFTSLRRRLGKQLYDRDGAPLSLKDIQEDLKSDLSMISQEDLDGLVQKGIFKKFEEINQNGTKETRYDFVNSKQSTGINNTYRVYSPDSMSFPTLTATGSPDYISLKPFHGKTPKEYCQYFIENIYKKQLYRSLSDREIARLQGFPDHFILCKHGNAKRQLGNAVSVPVIEQLVIAIKNTGVFKNQK
jgi:DNA (cytosine-5)-methyltransferase 1